MPARRNGTDLPDWIDTARATRLPGINGFAHGLATNLEAVITGLTVHWSPGGTEAAASTCRRRPAGCGSGGCSDRRLTR
ncbi:hypothetical protein [Streptomyces mirabilis]|uniref:hypothetical protein n=1 Tax=Streptomyces mirabilis TaxID=68239 RepID=UPI003244EB59